MQRRLAHEDDPQAFAARWSEASAALSERITGAIAHLAAVGTERDVLLHIAETSLAAGVDGHRADIMMLRAATALAAWEGRGEATRADVDRAARFVLPHRMRRRPFEHISG